uniref:F-box/kelch-repeat protein At3g23880-like n=1 Tax=Nicotiana tabacum TaxID=4097 RepID=A0A1S4CXF2_TOBAC|nr:PREDICTED: F-box/kelch-repeat protein At3g23880-like [Nicotiana tabacum]
MFGFGYDELHDDYKIVGIDRYLGHDGLRHAKAKIFSVNSDSWTSVDNFQEGVVFIRSKGMFVNGKLYWTNNSTTRRLRCYNSWGIVSINLADEKWEKVEKPCYGEGDFGFTLCLGVLGSDLSLFCNNWSGRVDLWVMKDDGVKESWTRIVNIKRPDNYIVHLFFPFFCKSNEGEILFDCGSFFLIYNPKDDLIKYREVTNCDAFREANIYVESLIWPYSKYGAKDAATRKAHMEKIM